MSLSPLSASTAGTDHVRWVGAVTPSTMYMYLDSVHPQTNLHIFHYISITSHTTLSHQSNARRDERDRAESAPTSMAPHVIEDRFEESAGHEAVLSYLVGLARRFPLVGSRLRAS